MVLLDNEDIVRTYLNDCEFTKQKKIYKIERLTGGLVNFIYRITFDNSNTIILKYFPPFIASLESKPEFSQERYFVEKNALLMIGDREIVSSVKVPRIYWSDDENFVLLMEDIGSGYISLLSALTKESKIDENLVKKIVESLWSFLKGIEPLWKTKSQVFENKPACDILNSYIIPLYSEQAKKYEIETELKDYIANAKPFQVISEPNEDSALSYGDLWPNSILLNPQDGNICIIDWEMCRIQKKNQDLKQLLCNLWVMKQNPNHFDSNLIDLLISGIQRKWLGDSSIDWRLVDNESKNYFILFVLTLLKEEHWKISDPRAVMLKALNFQK